jgi:hypothetical protein
MHLRGCHNHNNHNNNNDSIYVVDLPTTLDLGTIGGNGPMDCSHDDTPDVYWNNDRPMSVARHPNSVVRKRADNDLDLLSWFHVRNVTSPGTFLRDPDDDFVYYQQLRRNNDNQCRHIHQNATTTQDDDDNDDDVWLHGYWGNDWADHYVPLLEIINGTSYKVDSTTMHYPLKSTARYAVINSLSILDRPGEYYIDRKRRKLYIIPPNITTTTTTTTENEDYVSISTTPTLLEITNAHSIHFRRFRFSTSRGTSVKLINTTNITIQDGSITNVGGSWGIELNSTKETAITNMILEELQCGGMYVGDTIDNRLLLLPSNISITHNTIHHYGLWKRTYYQAIKYDNIVGMSVSHNTMGYAPHMATFGHGNDNVWEYNHFHDLCYETTDSGAFYAGRSWVDRGNVVRHSVFERVRRLEPNGLGWKDVNAIYLDDFMSGYTFHNITIRDTDMGIVVGGGRDNVVRNFTFIDVDYPIHVDKRGLNWGHKSCAPPNGMLPKELSQYLRSEVWSQRYPELVRLLDDRPCTPVNNHISDIKFCHSMMNNNTLWFQSGDTSVAELLIWENTFVGIRQDMSYCDGDELSDNGATSEEVALF